MSPRERIVTPAVLRSLTVETRPWLSCDDCFDLMDEYVERRLADPGYDDPVVATHLRACAACDEETRSLLELVAGSPTDGGDWS